MKLVCTERRRVAAKLPLKWQRPPVGDYEDERDATPAGGSVTHARKGDEGFINDAAMAELKSGGERGRERGGERRRRRREEEAFLNLIIIDLSNSLPVECVKLHTRTKKSLRYCRHSLVARLHALSRQRERARSDHPAAH